VKHSRSWVNFITIKLNARKKKLKMEGSPHHYFLQDKEVIIVMETMSYQGHMIQELKQENIFLNQVVLELLNYQGMAQARVNMSVGSIVGKETEMVQQYHPGIGKDNVSENIVDTELKLF
jgi:hypothetical protein